MELAFARVGGEADLKGVVFVEMKVEFDLRGDLAQVDFDLLLEMRIAAQQRRQKLPGGGDIDLADAALEGEGHERTGRALGEAVEAMLHADQLQIGPVMVGFLGEKKAGVLERFAQAGGGDDFKIKVEARAVAAAIARFFAGMELRDDARAQGAELDGGAVLPVAAAARAPLGEPGEEAAVVVEERAGGAVLVGEQEREKIAEPAEEDLVVGGEKFGAVGRLIAEAADLEEIARAFLELGRVDAQIDLDAGLERVETRLDFPDDAKLAARMRRGVVLAVVEPVEQFLAEGVGFLARAPAARNRGGRGRAGATAGILPLLRRWISRASRQASFSVSGSRQMVVPMEESKKSGRSMCASLRRLLSWRRRSHSLRA